MDTYAHAQAAEVRVEAMPATIITHGIPSAAQVGIPTLIRDPRHVTDQLVVMARCLEWTPLTESPTVALAVMTRSLWWVQLTDQPTWMVLVVDEVGEVLTVGIGDDSIDALVGAAEHLLSPSYAGSTLLMVMDEVGEVLTIGAGDDQIEVLASVANTLLPGHPG
jgi:hypothetical protein